MDRAEENNVVVWHASKLLSHGSGLIYRFMTDGYTNDVELMKRYFFNKEMCTKRMFFRKSENKLNESDLKDFVDGGLVELHFNNAAHARMDVDLDEYVFS